MEAERVPNRGLSEIEQRLHMHFQFEQGALDGKWPENSVLSFLEMAGEFGECDAPVAGNVERRIASLIPAIVANATGKTSIESAVG